MFKFSVLLYTAAPVQMDMVAMAAAPAPNAKVVPPIEGGTQTVQASVTLNVKYE